MASHEKSINEDFRKGCSFFKKLRFFLSTFYCHQRNIWESVGGRDDEIDRKV
jgi:hypothetical protein